MLSYSPLSPSPILRLTSLSEKSSGDAKIGDEKRAVHAQLGLMCLSEGSGSGRRSGEETMTMTCMVIGREGTFSFGGGRLVYTVGVGCVREWGGDGDWGWLGGGLTMALFFLTLVAARIFSFSLYVPLYRPSSPSLSRLLPPPRLLIIHILDVRFIITR